ncbi:MAG: DUF1572 domain-containing protein [Phycisphaerales bacterium]|nr:DUF1572 domain-containing protein [Phycisphaerales bacterium]
MIAETFMESIVSKSRNQKQFVERAIRQLSDAQVRQPLDENTNSIAVIMKHMAGNMLSRWTDFLTSDGEKTWRKRDSEFVDDFNSTDELTAFWEKGWACFFSELETLTAEDLTKTTPIRGEPHTVIDAIHRQLDHNGYHGGQIVLIARILAKDNWTTLTIPRGPGESEAYNQRVWKS